PYAHPSPASLSPLSLHDALPIFPRLLVLLPLVPPLLLRRELLDPERLGLRVALVALGVWVLVEPDLLRRLALCEEEQVRLDAGEIGKHTSELQSREKLVCRLLLE